MVGGRIKFTINSSAAENIQYVKWNFGDGQTSKTLQPVHQFKKPANHSVAASLYFKDGSTCNYSYSLPLNLEPGDLLFARTTFSDVIPGEWSHIGIYIGNETVVEALPTGVRYSDISSWYYPKMTWVEVKRVVAPKNVIDNAVIFAKSIADTHPPYDFQWLNPFLTGKQTDGNSWYCSEIVWAAYLTASNGKIDLDSGTYIPQGNLGILINDRDPVTPSEIYDSPWVTSIGGHKEYRVNPNNYTLLF